MGYKQLMLMGLLLGGCATTPEEEMAARLQNYQRQCGDLTYDECLQRKLVEEQIHTARQAREQQLSNALGDSADRMARLQQQWYPRQPAANNGNADLELQLRRMRRESQ